MTRGMLSLIAFLTFSGPVVLANAERALMSLAIAEHSFEAITNGMTLASALKAVGPKLQGSEVAALLQMDTGRHHHKHHRLRTESAGVGQAMTKLNEMIVESEKKLDLEDVKCSQYIESQSDLMEQVMQDISSFNAMAAAARAHILGAMTTIQLIESKLPELKSDMLDQIEKCSTDLAALKAQLVILEDDAGTMGTILGLLDCPVTLLQCGGGARGELGHRLLRSKISQLRSQRARRNIQALIDKTYRHHRQQRRNLTLAPGAMNTTDEPDAAKAARKCSISGSPSCIILRDRFLDINADMLNSIDEIEENIAKMSNECAETKDNFEAQVKDFETRLKGSQTDLAEATETQNQAEEQSRLKNAQYLELEKDLNKEKHRCKASITNLQNEICGLKRIRQELLKIKSQPLVIQDCEVSKWTPQGCSATCGGGIQTLTRTITIPTEGGAACPPLAMDRKCSMKACPIDCEVSSWGGWSSCSAKCGGGVMQRTRSVVTEPQHGGDPCGSTSVAESCNIQSCDRKCVLRGWTAWSGCSKACGGGFQKSFRRIKTRALGQGKCPSVWSRYRRRFKRCNRHACVPKLASSPTLKCRAKLDVVILLDGSGSLGSSGWSATKTMGKMLVDAFKGSNSEVAVMLFSGPTTTSKLRGCFSGRGVTLKDCGITWVDHFQTGDAKIAATATKIGTLQWPRATTMTSMALAAAENELRNGRADATSLVIVITDGRPMSGRHTYQASLSLRKKARLMWVPVGRNVPIDFLKHCASKPVRDNMVIIKDFKGLTSPAAINDIIADACPKVE